jgi:hypothetical protein
MENFIDIAKVLIPIMLTPIINRFISSFRIRQLYLSFDDVLPSKIPNSEGHISIINIYNKGKDKEKEIEIIFPKTTNCQILSSDYPDIKVEDNKIKIDRLLAKQKITMSVYTNSTEKFSLQNKPFLKSEEANGKSYDGKLAVPPSAGPAALIISFFIALTLTFTYAVLADVSLSYPYYAIRYKSFMDQGFRPSIISSNSLISQSSIFSEKYPITLLDPVKLNSIIEINLKIKNTKKEKIYATIYYNMKNSDYDKEMEATKKEKDLSKSVELKKVIDEKYGYSRDDKFYWGDIEIIPNEEKSFILQRTILPTTTDKNFKFYLLIEGSDDSGSTFRDHYEFDPENQKNQKISTLLKSFKNK